MKGIVLAGGRATRLRPLTWVTSKQLLPVYDRPMVYYPIQTLLNAGIKDILIIVAPDYSGQFLNLLGEGTELGAHFNYAVQKEPRGLADAFIVGRNFIGDDSVAMILGDNIFDPNFNPNFGDDIKGAKIFAKKVHDPQRFGVVEFDNKGNVISIEEKPEVPKSEYAAVGLYAFDNRVVEYAQNLKPSDRGEIEIVDLINIYLHQKELVVDTLDGLWEDAGTFESLLRVGNYMADLKPKQP